QRSASRWSLWITTAATILIALGYLWWAHLGEAGWICAKDGEEPWSCASRVTEGRNMGPDPLCVCSHGCGTMACRPDVWTDAVGAVPDAVLYACDCAAR